MQQTASHTGPTCIAQDVYLLKNRNPTGPFSSDDVRSWFKLGIITDRDLVWYEGLWDWVSVSKYLGSEDTNREVPETTAGAPSRLPSFSSLKDLSFYRSVPGLIVSALGAIALVACLQIVMEVWRHSDRPRETKKRERDARDAAIALEAFAQSFQETTAMEYERIRREDVDNQIRQTRQDWNDYQIFHMTPEQRADEVNRQTLKRINGR